MISCDFFLLWLTKPFVIHVLGLLTPCLLIIQSWSRSLVVSLMHMSAKSIHCTMHWESSFVLVVCWFIKIDDCTFNVVNTYVFLVHGTDVEIRRISLSLFRQSFEYEHVHLLCSCCSCIAHRISPLRSYMPPSWF